MTNKIELDDPTGFAYGVIDGFTIIAETVYKDQLYKDFAPAETIARRDSDGTFWRQEWSKYCSYYGQGESEYESYAVQVVRREETITVVKVHWDEVK